jgi:APA family basic amino acid/polyamine antiporter
VKAGLQFLASKRVKQATVRNDWQPKLGDKIVRRPSLRIFHLRRSLGIPALYAAGYGDVGSSIYYALGIVAVVALGATPVALALAGIAFVFVALTYAEGSAMFPEAGGSASFAHHAFNDLVSFISGWALILTYIATIAISAYTIPPYLGYFWPILKESPMAGTIVSMAIVLFLMLINVIGIRQSSIINVSAAVIDLSVQILIVVLGALLVFNLSTLHAHIVLYWPSWENLFVGIALAAVAYTGVETISQMAEETRQPTRRVPFAHIMTAVTVLVIFAGIATVGLSTMSPAELATEWAHDPVAGIAHNLSGAIVPHEMAAKWFSAIEPQIIFTWVLTTLRELLPVLVGLLAASILLIAANAGLIGISRVTYFLGRRGLVPGVLASVHPRFRTPWVTIILFSVISIVLLIPGFFAPQAFIHLGALYAFGAAMTYFLAHASILKLRDKYPELPRPFKIVANFKIRGREMPVTSILGMLVTAFVWLVLVITQTYSRWVGLAWMLFGLGMYFLFRRLRRASPSQTDGSPTGLTGDKQ